MGAASQDRIANVLFVPAAEFTSDCFICLSFSFQVTEVDENLLLFRNLESLTLTANYLQHVDSRNLPAKLKVLLTRVQNSSCFYFYFVI
jgi:hypothetical protein